MLTIDPVKWSPFFNDTCSACAVTQLQTSTTDNADQTSFDTGNLSPRIRSASGSIATAPNSCWCYWQTLAGAHNRAPHFGSLLSFKKRATYFENAIIL